MKHVIKSFLTLISPEDNLHTPPYDRRHNTVIHFAPLDLLFIFYNGLEANQVLQIYPKIISILSNPPIVVVLRMVVTQHCLCRP